MANNGIMLPSGVAIPEFRKYKVAEVGDDGCYIKLYADISNLQECDLWISEYSKLTSTKWIVRSSAPNLKRLACSKKYLCHRSSHGKVQGSTRKSKDCNCQAKIKISVKWNTVGTVKKTLLVMEGMPAIITIYNKHTHSIDTPEEFAFLPGLAETKQTFEAYFSNGMGIAQSINYHVNELELKGNDDALGNASLNPKYRTVRYWYDKWRQVNPESHFGMNTLAKLEAKQAKYAESGITINTKEEPFAVIIITPLMRRAHALSYAGEIVFVDSSASCDAENHSITFFLTVCSDVAVPLAVVITDGQSMSEYTTAFRMVKEALGEGAFNGKEFPKLFITDDSAAERDALQTIFPNSQSLLCSSNVAQSAWKWLTDEKNKIPKDCHQQLYFSFKDILNASSIAEAEVAFKRATETEIATKYPRWLEFLTKYWTRRQDWCSCYHDTTTGAHQTNDFVRLYKDILLSRCKTFNVVALVEFTCTTMEQYYIKRLKTLAKKRCDSELVSKVFQSNVCLDNQNEDQSHVEITNDSSSDIESEVQCAYKICDSDLISNPCLHNRKEEQSDVEIANDTMSDVENEVHGANEICDSELVSKTCLENLKEEQSDIDITYDTIRICESELVSKVCLDNLKEGQSHFEITNDTASGVDSTVQCNDNTINKVISLIKERHKKFGTSAASISKVLTRLKNIRTKSEWDRFINSIGCIVPLKRSSEVVKVQPERSSKVVKVRRLLPKLLPKPSVQGSN